MPFALLLNLVSASNAQNTAVLWGFISRYAPGVTPATHPELDRLVGYAIRYFEDFVKPAKVYRAARRGGAAGAGQAFGRRWPRCRAGADGEAIQNAALNVARKIERYQDHAKQSPEGGPGVSVAFFQMIYQVLIGQERGPRFGSFAALYGIAETRALIDKALAGELAADRRAALTDQFVAVGGGPKMPSFACLRLLLGRRVGTAGDGARPAVRHQPGPDILLAEPAAGDQQLPVGLGRNDAGQRPAPQPQADRRARADAARPFGAFELAGLLGIDALRSGDGDPVAHRFELGRADGDGAIENGAVPVVRPYRRRRQRLAERPQWIARRLALQRAIVELRRRHQRCAQPAAPDRAAAPASASRREIARQRRPEHLACRALGCLIRRLA